MGDLGATDVNARIGGVEIGLDVQHATPPVYAYVGKDDSLWIMCANNAGAHITVNARFLMPNGDIKLNQWALTFGFSRAAQFRQIQLPECFLLSVAVVNNTINSATNISCYASAIVSRSAPTSFNAAQTLCQGYTNGTMPISWPTGVNTTNVDCVGVLSSITGTQPFAGVNISETVPLNAKWALRSIRFSLTTSAAVANRVVVLLLTDGTNAWYSCPSFFNQTAGQAIIYTFAAGGPAPNGNVTGFIGPLPNPTLLMPTFKIITITNGLDAGDQFSALQYEVEEWLLP